MRKWVQVVFHQIVNMIRLFIRKMTDFWPIKVYIFGMYSPKAFQRCVAWCKSSPTTEVTDEWFFQKKTSERVISRERKLEKF